MRYIINELPGETEHVRYDVVVIGSGLAGLYTALHIDEGLSCCILTKEDVQVSNSWLAQGGIAAAIAVDDKPIYHFDDTMLAGAGLGDPDAVRLLVSEAPREIRSLVDMNVPFDLDLFGELDITQEGGHRQRRVVHAGGDATGKETVKALAQIVSQRANVSFMPHYFFADVLTDRDGTVTGCIVLDGADVPLIIDCANIVIATGGVGQLYLSSTNPSVATGDGLAAAMRVEAPLRDMEFIQFHPTGLWSPEKEDRAFLISEALRGEGALLRNAAGERFMEGKHELAELAPRDIVAREIFREMQRTGEAFVYLDITAHSAAHLSRRFPTIYNECLKRGTDISRDYIPVCPVQHYLIGGIETDLFARTKVKGLYACGEAASTGVHGANRLASNSMLECLVFGRRAARDICRRMETAGDCVRSSPINQEKRPEKALDLEAMKSELQSLMSTYCGVLRREAGLQTAKARIDEISETLESVYVPGRAYLEMINLAAVAGRVIACALSRRESAGAHYREN